MSRDGEQARPRAVGEAAESVWEQGMKLSVQCGTSGRRGLEPQYLRQWFSNSFRTSQSSLKISFQP